MKPDVDWPKLKKHCNSRKSALLAERQPFEARWKDVAQHVDPMRGRFDERDSNGKIREINYRKIINSRSTKGLRKMTAGFMSGHTSKSRPWFRITVSDPVLAQHPSVKAWCDDVGQLIRDILAKSNFYTALPNFYTERHAFGVAAMACVEDTREVVRFHTFTVGEYAIGLNERGTVDTFWRRYTLSAGQIRDKFSKNVGGDNHLPDKVRDALKHDREDQKFTIECLIEPNPDKKPGTQGRMHKAFRVVDWMDGKVLDVQSDYENPILASRWDAVSGAVYSTSPAIDALGDIKQLQHQEGVKLKLGDKIADPPMGLPDSMRNQRASLMPGAITYLSPTDAKQQVGALYVPNAQAVQVIREDIAEVQGRVDEAFMLDLFQMLAFLDDRQRTAYEISARQEEKLSMLGPFLESLTDEVLDPAISRVYGIADRRGLVPEPPEEMRGADVSIEYTSTMAQAQKASGISTIERVVGFVGGLAQATQDQSVWDKFDSDEAIDIYADQVGVPARVVRGDDAVGELRMSRQQQQQMQQMAQMAPAMKQGADAIAKLAETAPVEGSIAEGLSA